MNTVAFLIVEHARQRADMATRHAEELAGALKTLSGVDADAPAVAVAASSGPGRPVAAPGVAGARKRGQ